MANSDIISEKQIWLLDSLAENAISGYDSIDDLDLLVEPVYGCRVEELNRGQASMLIDDLKYELGIVGSVKPDYESIFGPIAPDAPAIIPNPHADFDDGRRPGETEEDAYDRRWNNYPGPDPAYDTRFGG